MSFFGLRQPLYVIMISPLEKKAFKLSGEEIPLDELIQEAPDIKSRLAKIGS